MLKSANEFYIHENSFKTGVASPFWFFFSTTDCWFLNILILFRFIYSSEWNLKRFIHSFNMYNFFSSPSTAQQCSTLQPLLCWSHTSLPPHLTSTISPFFSQPVIISLVWFRGQEKILNRKVLLTMKANEWNAMKKEKLIMCILENSSLDGCVSKRDVSRTYKIDLA